MHDKSLIKLLQANQRIYGTAIISSSPVWSSALSPAGLDFVFLDTEHIPLDRKTLSWMCQTYNAQGLVPIVRIPKPDPFKACMVLDGGARGIIAPYIESEEQVRVLVGATKMRPLKGKRLERILNIEKEKVEHRDIKIGVLKNKDIKRGEELTEKNKIILEQDKSQAIANRDIMMACIERMGINPEDVEEFEGTIQYSDDGYKLVIKNLVVREKESKGKESV